MPSKSVVRGLVFLCLGFLAAPGAHAQITKQRLDAIGAHYAAPRAFYKKLTPEQRDMLSGSARNFYHVVNHWQSIERKALILGKVRGLRQPSAALPTAAMKGIGSSPGPVQVSDPSTDFAFGPSGGFTNNETSTAWCGQDVLVGYNDSGSVLESLLAPNSAGISFNGYSQSGNQGGSFSDEGFLPEGITGDQFDELEGDPVATCANASTFYYSSLFFNVTVSSAQQSAVTVSKSTDGGVTFGQPVIAVAKDAFTHTLDKDWSAVNPANPNQLAVTYTDFDVSSTNGCNPNVERIAIELVSSTDGGNTWSAPTVVDQVCSSGLNFDQGSQVAFSGSGAVYVAWESYAAGTLAGVGRQIMFSSEPSLGGTFSAPVVVANLIGTGDGFEIEGGIRAFLDLQSMAVDRSSTPTGGNIYIAWHGSDFSDSLGIFNEFGYFFSDVFVSRSSDGGATWTSPVEVNTNNEPMRDGLGTDSFMPGVAVDNTSGHVAVCWYDRRNDPRNFLMDRFCGESSDGGATFTNMRMTEHSFAPIHGTDDEVNPQYLGDYDGLASDGLGTTGGFIGAFQIVGPQGGNILLPAPNVFARSFN